MTLSITALKRHSAFSAIAMSIVMLNIVMLKDVYMNVVMLSVMLLHFRVGSWLCPQSLYKDLKDLQGQTLQVKMKIRKLRPQKVL